MKIREANKSAKSKQRARQIARQHVEIADLKVQLAAALQRIDKLEQENARLKEELAAAQKNSSNSSKPPSSDIVNPKKAAKKKRKRKRKPGAGDRHRRRRSASGRCPATSGGAGHQRFPGEEVLTF